MKKFTRTVEDFTCEHCGSQVTGNGFTNHCPSCLWSKHVDIAPGDRAATCANLMEPIAVSSDRKHGYRLLHRCSKCGAERWNRVSPNDSFEALLALARSFSSREPE